MLYLTADKFPVFVPFGVIGFYRYFWYLIRLAAALVYRPIPPPLHPTYAAHEDVTIIVPTIDAGPEFQQAAYSWLQSDPHKILIVTEASMAPALRALAASVDAERIEVLTVPKANKRLQMAHGIRHTTTDLIVFADDDAIWPPTMLRWMLACFEDQQVGGVGTSQRVKPQAAGGKMTVWETLAAFRLSIRNFEIASSTHIDGGVPCLSGRTAAYRTVILKDPRFLHGFTHDYWLGKYLLNSGDDKFLTRWMVSHGWATYIQVCPEAELLSTMKPDWRFLKQVLRWTRNTWRSDIRSIFKERYIWSRHPYIAYCMIDKFINPFTLMLGPILVSVLIYKSTKPVEAGGYHLPAWRIVLSYLVWLLATRTFKLLPHLWFRPRDIVYVPAYIAFGYYFAVMKLYALFTLHKTGWGTRAGVGLPEDANEADASAGGLGFGEKEKSNNKARSGSNGPASGSANGNGSGLPTHAHRRPPSDPFYSPQDDSGVEFLRTHGRDSSTPSPPAPSAAMHLQHPASSHSQRSLLSNSPEPERPASAASSYHHSNSYGYGYGFGNGNGSAQQHGQFYSPYASPHKERAPPPLRGRAAADDADGFQMLGFEQGASARRRS